jgi:hypothetical protein
MAGVIVVLVAWVLNYPLARWNISVSGSSSIQNRVLTSRDLLDHQIIVESEG